MPDNKINLERILETFRSLLCSRLQSDSRNMSDSLSNNLRNLAQEFKSYCSCVCQRLIGCLFPSADFSQTHVFISSFISLWLMSSVLAIVTVRHNVRIRPRKNFVLITRNRVHLFIMINQGCPQGLSFHYISNRALHSKYFVNTSDRKRLIKYSLSSPLLCKGGTVLHHEVTVTVYVMCSRHLRGKFKPTTRRQCP